MKGIDFLKGFNGLAEDIVLEAKNPQECRKQKKPKVNIIKFMGVAAAVTLLVGMVAAGKLGIIHKNAGSSVKHTNIHSKEVEEEDVYVMDIRTYTNLEVITDRLKFTSVTQDQNYNPETDSSAYFSGLGELSMTVDIGDTVYIARKEGDLFAFQKETNTAKISCGKSDCKHKIEEEGECEANLRVVDADVSGLQYYKGNLYYTLSTYNSSLLYKMSVNMKKKQYYISLLGENEYGAGGWLIHRGYIYFYSSGDGFYRMPVDNPKQKEKLITLMDSSIQIQADGSYIYFVICGKGAQAVARYNIESEQIEQFTDITKKRINKFLINNGKIYFVERPNGTIFSYDVNTGKKESFLSEKTGEQITNYSIVSADFDYIYVEERVYSITDSINSPDTEKRVCVYTWDGIFAGAISSFSKIGGIVKTLKPLQVFHNESSIWAGNDNERIYFIEEAYDTQCDENGYNEKFVAGTGKRTISYINKSELSVDGEVPPKHIAYEMDYGKE